MKITEELRTYRVVEGTAGEVAALWDNPITNWAIFNVEIAEDSILRFKEIGDGEWLMFHVAPAGEEIECLEDPKLGLDDEDMEPLLEVC